MKRIFISRHIATSSPIRNVIGSHNLIHRSLIEFSALPFEAPKADWIFFYSRNGVKYFFEGGHYELFPYLWACLGEGTADELLHYISDISFIGNGTPEEVINAYKTTTNSNEVTCFIRAENSLDSIHKSLGRANDFSLAVYTNIPKTNIPEQDFDILIFTSPMNVDAWFKKRNYNDEIVISIGKTTADHLATYSIKNVITAMIPSEESIAKSLLNIL